jgi:malonate decarboxylase beta subunit
MNAPLARKSWFEATARARIAGLLDAGSFSEWLPPAALQPSPHLAQLDLPGAFDDGVVVGYGKLEKKPIFVIAQEGQFMGGAVGEIHGAKIVGTLRRAAVEKPAAVLFLIDSGGVRLHEANAGLIAITEIMRAVLDARAAGVPVIALVGGSCGAFGGMGIVAKLCSAILISEEGRLALSGPEVIETVMGVEEFDAKDRALVWRVTGGKHRYLAGTGTDPGTAARRPANPGKPPCRLRRIARWPRRLGRAWHRRSGRRAAARP